MSPIPSFAFALARRLVPWDLRKRLNKYRGPRPILRWRLAHRGRPEVLGGPFAGLGYPRFSTGSEYFPKLLGVYEKELHPWLDILKPGTFSRLIVVGAAEGYYVGGLARWFPGLPVTSFESDPYGRAAIEAMAAVNGFADRLGNLGHCHLPDFIRALDGENAPLVVMDIEGGEKELLVPAMVPALQFATLLVEIHDNFLPGLDVEIRQRFQPTHDIDEVLSRPRVLADARDLPVPPAWHARLLPLMEEHRPGRMRWFLLRPRPHSSTQ